jgi:hypothetical protein
MDRLSIYASTIGFQWLATVIILWRTRAHGISVMQLGLAIPRPALAITISVVLAVLISLNQAYSLRRLVATPSEIQGVLPQLALKLFPQDDVERLIFFALVATVAMCEEFIYRGFIQRVFQDWSGGYCSSGNCWVRDFLRAGAYVSRASWYIHYFCSRSDLLGSSCVDEQPASNFRCPFDSGLLRRDVGTRQAAHGQDSGFK